MDRSDVINLISETRVQDAYGVWRPTRTSRQVYARVVSAPAYEFFEGGRNGLNPQYKMTMFFGDYNGESIVEYKGEAFSVYRKYQTTTDTIELYVERKGGTNGA
jgi:hypothetical protein